MASNNTLKVEIIEPSPSSTTSTGDIPTTIIFIHGWLCSASVDMHDFEPIFATSPPLLSSRYRRIYINLPGMGGSPIDDTISTLDDMFARVSSFISENILSHASNPTPQPTTPIKFLLVGSSCGALFVRALAHRFSAHVQGFLLRVPLIEPETSKRDIDHPFVPALSDPKLTASSSSSSILQTSPVQTHSYTLALLSKHRETYAPALALAQPCLSAIRASPAKYTLAAPMHTRSAPFRGPALVLTGRQDAEVGYRDAWRELVDACPRGTFVVLDRAGHAFPVDEGERALFAALVREWLGRVEEMEEIDGEGGGGE